jgi:Spy/CpxP family protein refolding chaperone
MKRLAYPTIIAATLLATPSWAQQMPSTEVLPAAASMLLAQAGGAKADTAQAAQPGYPGMGPGMMGGAGNGPAYGPGRMYGPGGGYGPGGYGMGPGMMYGPGTGYGPGAGYGMGPGMMYGPGGGYGMGPGMMYGHGFGYGPAMMGGWAMAYLNLTDDQQSKIEKLGDELRHKQWDLVGKMMDEQAKLRDLYGAAKFDRSAIAAAYKRIGELRQQAIEARLDMLGKVEGILTQEQRDKLRQEWGNGHWWMMGQ